MTDPTLVVPPEVPSPPQPPGPPLADLSHRDADRRPDWSIIPEFIAGRVSQTVACTDADALPRVDGAGDTIERDGERVQVMHNGVLVSEGCYYGVLSSEIIRCLRGVHEPQEEVAFDAILRRLASMPPVGRAPVMIELGSYWAYYSLWFLDSFPEGRTICLEPDPRNLVVGEHNFALNGRSGMFLNAAIGASSGGTMPFQPDDGSEPIALPTHDLQSLLRLLDEPAVDVLLADIQGGEVPLLANSLDLLRSGVVRFLVVSTHDLHITGSAMTHQHVLRMLLDAGAHIVCEHSVTESVSGDGLVVAAFDPGDGDLVVEISHARARDSLVGEWEPRLEEYRRRLMETEVELAAVRRELEDARRGRDAAESGLGSVRSELDAVRAERDEARTDLDRIRSSFPLRARRAVLAPFRGRRISGS